MQNSHKTFSQKLLTLRKKNAGNHK